MTNDPHDPGGPYDPDASVPPTEQIPATFPHREGAGGTVPPGPPMATGVTPTPDPRRRWYEDKATLAAVIVPGLALLFLLIAWLIWWSGDDDPESVVIEGSTTTTTVLETTLPTASIVDVDPLPTDSTTTTTSTTSTTTTTTVAPTTTTEPVATTAAPAPTTAGPTTTSIPVVSVPPSEDATLLDIIQVSPDLSRLAELVADAGLEDALDGADPLTVFAPSDQAFEQFEATPGAADVISDPDRLADLLLGHVVDGGLDSAAVLASETLTALNGETIEVDPEAMTVDGATLVVIDVEAANGVLHAIDRVIVTG